MVTTNINPINDILLGIAFIGGVIIYARTKIPRQEVADLKSLLDTQGKTIEELKKARLEDTKLIGKLQGQIETYKELPLQELANGIKKVGEGQDKILQVLQTSAEIAAKSASDGGLLVRTVETK